MGVTQHDNSEEESLPGNAEACHCDESGDEEEFDEESRWLEAGVKPDWTRVIDTSMIDVDLNREAGTFLQLISRELGGSSWTRKRQGGTRRWPGVLLTVAGDDCALLIEPKDATTFRATVWGAGAEQPVDVRRWSKAIRNAAARIRTLPSYDWNGAVGLHSVRGGISGLWQLRERSTIGRLSLISDPEPYAARFVRDSSPFSGCTVVEGHPILVFGNCQAMDEFAAIHIAQRELHNLAVVCSVFWPACWVVYSEGIPGGDPRRYSSTHHFRADGRVVDEQFNGWPREMLEVSDQMRIAFEVMDRDQELASAGTMFHDGLLLSKEHPSIAVLCLVAVIEKLQTRRGSRPERCSECNSIMGSGRRFAEALASVSSEGSDALRKYKAIYDRRSRSVHDAQLHGGEADGGPMNFRSWDDLTRDIPDWCVLEDSARSMLKAEFGSSESWIPE